MRARAQVDERSGLWSALAALVHAILFEVFIRDTSVEDNRLTGSLQCQPHKDPYIADPIRPI